MKKRGESDLLSKLVTFGIPLVTFFAGMAWNGFHIAEQLATKTDVKIMVDESVKAQNEKFERIHQEIMQSTAATDQQIKMQKEELERYSDANRNGLRAEVAVQVAAIKEAQEKSHMEQTAFQAKTSTALEGMAKAIDSLTDSFKYWMREQGPASRHRPR